MIAGHPIALNLPAFLIVAAVTVLLVYGIRESAKTNTWIVVTKVAVVVFFISFGAFLVNPTNWHPFMPTGLAGMMGGAAIVFFAFIGFDAVSTTAEETRNPQRDVPIGIIASLIICTVLYVLMSGVLTGIKKYRLPGRLSCGRDRIRRPPLGTSIGQRWGIGRYDFSAARFSTRPTPHLHGHGARRIASTIFRENSPPLSHATHHNYLDRNCGRWRGYVDGHRIAR